MGSTPIESTPTGDLPCGAHPTGVLDAPGDVNPQGRAEGHRPDDAVYRVSTLDVKWVQQSTGASAYQWMARFESRRRACQAAISCGKAQGACDPQIP